MTGKALPKTKANELVDKINALKLAAEHDELLLARIKKEAKQLTSTGPSTGYTVLGMVATIERDSAEMHRNHRLAIANSGGELWPLQNYVNSLINLGFLGEASDLAIDLHRREPMDLSLLQLALLASARSGRVGKALELFEDARKLQFDGGDARDDVVSAAQAKAFIDSVGIEEATLVRAVTLAQEVAHSNREPITGVRMYVASDESKFLSYSLIMDSAAGALAALSLALVDRLVAEWEDFPAEKLSLGYTSAMHP